MDKYSRARFHRWQKQHYSSFLIPSSFLQAEIKNTETGVRHTQVNQNSAYVVL